MRKIFMIFTSIVSLILISSIVGFAQVPDILWTKMFGASESNEETFFSVCKTTNGDFVAAGKTGSFGAGSDDFYLVRVSNDGDSVWAQTYGGPHWEHAQAVAQTYDSGFIVIGTAYGDSTDVFVVKTDSIGDTVWTGLYGGNGDQSGEYGLQATDGGYIVVGSTGPYSDRQLYILKLDSLGIIDWMKTYGGNSNERGRCIQKTSDNGYIIVGSTQSFGAGESDVYLLKTNIDGDTLWTRTFGGVNSDNGRFVRETSDGGFIIVGDSESFTNGREDIYIVKTDSSGDLIWAKNFGSEYYDRGYCVIESDSTYIITGDVGYMGYSEGYLIKLRAATGDSIWAGMYGGSGEDRFYSLIQSDDGNFVIVGVTSSFGVNNAAAWIVKVGEPTYIAENHDSRPQFFNLSSNYPNPFNSSTTIEFAITEPQHIKLAVYDLLGRVVESVVDEYRQVGVHTITFDASNLTSGIYFYRLQAGDIVETKRMVLLK